MTLVERAKKRHLWNKKRGKKVGASYSQEMSMRIRSSLGECENQFQVKRPKKRKPKKFFKRRPLSRQSRLRAVEARIYRIQRDKFMAEHPICQREGCGEKSVDCHHVRGRGRFYLDASTWKALCRACHQFVHNNARWARANGLLK